ncbi:MAG: SRPBCC domain-containing protein [Bacteroidetes bacterium]|nr:SRPBCC domain-containing protein [Bacteroidota bacterium]
MTTELRFDFTVDRAAQTVTITREFNADQSMVWDAFTKAEMLDQWVAPKPFSARTKHMDFQVGGRRFYAMVSPDGQERWLIQEYTSITPKTNFKMFNAFADENENPQLPGSDWDYTFSENNGLTKVRIVIHNESLERMDKMLEMGFTEGYKASINNLETLLEILSNQ